MSAPATLLHVFPTFVAAGLQQRAVQLMAAFGRRFRHTVVACDGRVDALALLPPGIDTRVVPPPAGSGPLGSVRAWRRLLAGERPDLLLTYNWGSFDAVLAGRSLGLAAHVHHEDGFNHDEAVRQKTRRVLARRFGLRRAYRIVVPSHNLVRIALEVWRLPPERVQLVSNGVHTDRFRPEDPGRPERGGPALREGLGIPADALVVGSVGHLRPVKNYPRLVEACAALPAQRYAARGVHLVLVGDGEERADLERLAGLHPPPGGRVHFLGHRDDLPPLYRAMDVFALSSDSEQQPVSLLEAMACGVPVVATDVGDIRAVLPPEAGGQVVPLAQGVPGLARALDALLGDPERRRALGELGLERARSDYSFAAMLAAYGALYEAAIKTGRTRPDGPI